MFFAQALQWYKKREVQEALLQHAENREISPRYGTGFGRRPDVITYPADILAFAQKKATSFHCSEERWTDPLAIKTGMTRKQLDEIREGWDLVLDIDCPDWSFSRLTTYLFVKALDAHNIKSISCKFSGNKGFHIGVPFESFPEEINGQETKNLFPEAPRALAQYLLDYIAEHFVEVNETEVIFANKVSVPMDRLKTLSQNELFAMRCPDCKNIRKTETTIKFVCSQCSHTVDAVNNKELYMRCPKCESLMERFEQQPNCKYCSSEKTPKRMFDIGAVIEVDTVLLASRHLFRMTYSLHEKTGLVSIPIELDNILAFDKQQAKPERVSFEKQFLPRGQHPGEATKLLSMALEEYEKKQQQELTERKNYQVPEEAIPQEYFPPCINNVLSGLKDGKKRALFILTNFFYSLGWTDEMVRDIIYEWNENNPEKLREVIIKGHLQIKKRKREVIPPPNCISDYYKALGVCTPDQFCKTIKNPAQYSVKKHRLANFKRDGAPKKKRQGLTEEQKAMRRAYRKKLKEEKQAKEENKTQTKKEKE